MTNIKDLRINEEIRTREIRLVSPDGQQLGVMTPREALRIARELNLDLVEVAPTAAPPVCKIMDYGRFKYEASRKEREARKNQKIVTIKEVKFRLSIEEHDFQTKAKNVIRFLEDGDKVKVTIMFRGREVAHSGRGVELCKKLAHQVASLAVVEKIPKVEGRNMTMILDPKFDNKPKIE